MYSHGAEEIHCLVVPSEKASLGCSLQAWLLENTPKVFSELQLFIFESLLPFSRPQRGAQNSAFQLPEGERIESRSEFIR